MIAMIMPMPDPSPQAPPGVEALVNQVLGYLMWAGGIVCFVSVATMGIVFMLNATGSINNGAKEIITAVGWVALGAGILAAASAIATALTGV